MGLGAVRLRAHRVHRHFPPGQDLRVPETNLADLSSLVVERNVASKIQVFVTNDPEAILFLTFNVKMCFTESLRNLFLTVRGQIKARNSFHSQLRSLDL